MAKTATETFEVMLAKADEFAADAALNDYHFSREQFLQTWLEDIVESIADDELEPVPA